MLLKVTNLTGQTKCICLYLLNIIEYTSLTAQKMIIHKFKYGQSQCLERTPSPTRAWQKPTSAH